MSRLQSSASHSDLRYRPALSVLLKQQQQHESDEQCRQQAAASSFLRSPYKSKQQMKGLGRNQTAATGGKTAKGLLRSASAAGLPLASNKLAPLSHSPQPQQQQFQQQQQQQFPLGQPRLQPANVWSADAPPSASPSRSVAAAPSVLVPAKVGESWESQAYRSLPHHSAPSSHYYSSLDNRPKLVHVHQYPDGSVVEECNCERGAKLVQQEQRAAGNNQMQQREESKEQQQQQQQQGGAAGAGGRLAPLRIDEANSSAASSSYPRAIDTSRQRSLYSSDFKKFETAKFSKLGKGYHASNNKSYIRNCLQDPGYGFQLSSLSSGSSASSSSASASASSASPQNFALEITQEHAHPEQSLRAIIPKVNWPSTTHHADFAAPSEELIKSYKRVGRDYRQAGNKSYIRYNLVDPDTLKQMADANSSSLDQSSSSSPLSPAASVRMNSQRIAAAQISNIPSYKINVPFTADTLHHKSFVDHSSGYAEVRNQNKASVLFGQESNAAENVWGEWGANTKGAVLHISLPAGRTLSLELSLTIKVLALKHLIASKAGISQNEQKLTFNGNTLDDAFSLVSYGIQSQAHIQLAVVQQHF